MTIKSLLFLLFLYICLVWVGAGYLHSGADIYSFGLLWTAIGLIALIVCSIGSHLFGLWRAWRARPVRPKAAAPSLVVHEDDAAIAALLAEANTSLTKSLGFAGSRQTKSICDFPWYLLIGPEASGKTTTFVNSAIEPQLLAGQGAGEGPVPTRMCNLWLAQDAIFVEVSGRAFNGNLEHWKRVLKALRGTSVFSWKRFWDKPKDIVTIRGIIGFSDVREFAGAAADPERFERYCHDWQERLQAVAEVFGVELPVYQVITKADQIKFFPEFFRRLPEAQTGQVLGCTLPLCNKEPSQRREVYADTEAKRLSKAFRLLYHALASRRIEHLTNEPGAGRRPAIYEFPRELKRIRVSLVQFLTEAFRPNPLKPGARLRGFYLTGVREPETPRMAIAGCEESLDLRSAGPGDATQMFDLARFDTTRMFKANAFAGVERPRHTRRHWLFVSELFHQVILGDQRLPISLPVDTRLVLYRRRALATVCGFCVLSCFALFVSWWRNVDLLNNVALAATNRPDKQGRFATLEDLQDLDALRLQVERLRNGAGWSLHWGLYSGTAVLDAARMHYFRRFHLLILDGLNKRVVDQLKSAPRRPRPDDPYEPVYQKLKTHLMLSGGTCQIEPAVVSQVLKEQRNVVFPQDVTEWQMLSDRQIDFYASELTYGNPLPLPVDVTARDNARQYLQTINGVDGLYKEILAEVRRTLPSPQRLGDYAPGYTDALRGGAEVSGVFTPDGWNRFESASKQRKGRSAGDACVLGQQLEVAGNTEQSFEVEQELRNLFVHDYVEEWRRFVSGFSVVPFPGPAEAAKKLEILASNRSPLLALFTMTARQTHFQAEETTGISKSLQDLLKKAEKAVPTRGPASTKPSEPGTAAITRFFQPVHAVAPPGSEMWTAQEYVAALDHLRGSMQDIARSSDPAVHQSASQNYEKALDAVRQVSRGFNPVGLDSVVVRLLEEPIRQTKRFIITDIAKVGTDEINGKLTMLCTTLKGALNRYPFRQSSREEASLDDLSKAFAPQTGEIWKFQAQTLADLVNNDGSQWKSKDPAQKPQVTPEMLALLNKAQSIVTAFYAGGAQPQLTYTLRPKLDTTFKDTILEFEVDGQLHRWTTVLQKQFTWPAAPGAKSGALARLRGSAAYAFASRAGLWGIFRIMGEAEPRPLTGPVVEWKYTRFGDGERDPIEPGPVRVEFAEFPGGVDIFNPRFFESLQCPARAVQ